jgi:hypothetical protein
MTASVARSFIFRWLEDFRAAPWFGGWLLQGQAAPEHVTVLTPGLAARATAAWDYFAHCLKADIGLDTYVGWIGDAIPDMGMLRWLYGAGAPAGVYVVPPALMRLRGESSQEAICAAVRVDVPRFDRSNLFFWKKHKAETLRQACQTAARARQSAPPDGVSPRTWRNMFLYARAGQLPARLRRAGLLQQAYSKLLKDAAACGAKEELLRFLAFETPYEPHLNMQRWLLAPNLFVPTADMWRFREVARAEAARQNIAAFRRLPAFDLWFRDWTTPRVRHGERRLLPLEGEEAEQLLQESAESRTKANGEQTPPLSPEPYPVRDEALYKLQEESNKKLHERIERIAEAVEKILAGPPEAASHLRNGKGAPASVHLLGPEEEVHVCGQPKPRLAPGAYRIVKALLDAYPGGLSKDQLSNRADYVDCHKAIASLTQDQDWRRAIFRPGEGYREGYRIRSLSDALKLK